MKLANTVSTALFTGALLVALSGCQAKEGPVEKAGKSVDQAAEQAGEKLEEAGEKLQDAAQGDDK
jgi:hypothetical protein